jgi:hypothetical protein
MEELRYAIEKGGFQPPVILHSRLTPAHLTPVQFLLGEKCWVAHALCVPQSVSPALLGATWRLLLPLETSTRPILSSCWTGQSPSRCCQVSALLQGTPNISTSLPQSPYLGALCSPHESWEACSGLGNTLA